jgi:hypothetical protein
MPNIKGKDNETCTRRAILISRKKGSMNGYHFKLLLLCFWLVGCLGGGGDGHLPPFLRPPSDGQLTRYTRTSISAGVVIKTARNSLVNRASLSRRPLLLEICSKVSTRTLYGTLSPAFHVIMSATSLGTATFSSVSDDAAVDLAASSNIGAVLTLMGDAVDDADDIDDDDAVEADDDDEDEDEDELPLATGWGDASFWTGFGDGTPLASSVFSVTSNGCEVQISYTANGDEE